MFVPMGSIEKKQALVQVMAFPELMITKIIEVLCGHQATMS